MFLDRRASLLLRPNSLTEPRVILEMSSLMVWNLASVSSSSGLASNPAFCRLRAVNAPVSRITRPPSRRSARLTFSAAGFIATSTSGASPAVSTLAEPKLIWNADTPKVVPAGALISAGKSGKVARSDPASAVEVVNWLPVNCMPSPESPAKRTTTDSSASSDGASGDACGDFAVVFAAVLVAACAAAFVAAMCYPNLPVPGFAAGTAYLARPRKRRTFRPSVLSGRTAAQRLVPPGST